MRASLRTVLLAALFAGVSGAVACSSKFSCTASECGQAPTAEQTSSCQAAEDGTCGDQYSDFVSCVAGQPGTCADAGTEVILACADQGAAAYTCCESNPSAPACKLLENSSGTDGGTDGG